MGHKIIVQFAKFIFLSTWALFLATNLENHPILNPVTSENEPKVYVTTRSRTSETLKPQNPFSKFVTSPNL